MSRLENKTAVITGGTTGIGLASAKRFVAEGAFVYIIGRTQDTLDAALAQLGANARGIRGDISNPDDLDRLYALVKEERGTIDVLFANAGIGSLAPLGSITPEEYETTFAVNVKGTLFTVQKALPLLTAGSSIILTGSTAGSLGTPGFSVYSASKAAIRGFVRSWAQDLRGSGIRVNVLAPGTTSTDTLNALLSDEANAHYLEVTPMGRIGDPDETAAVALFLASDDSSYMTGSEVFVDGGLAQV